MDVILNVYDLPELGVTNSRLIGMGAGFYHSGLQVGDMEYSFSPSGITRTRPLLPDFGRVRDQIAMGRYEGTREELAAIVHTLQTSDYAAGTYNVVHKNCNDFSEDFCALLLPATTSEGGSAVSVPDWINRAARIGRSVLPLSAGAPRDASSAAGGAGTTKEEALPMMGNVAPPTLRGAKLVGTSASSCGSTLKGNGSTVTTTASIERAVESGNTGGKGVWGFFSSFFGDSSSSASAPIPTANHADTTATTTTAHQPKGRGKTEAQKRALEKLVAAQSKANGK